MDEAGMKNGRQGGEDPAGIRKAVPLGCLMKKGSPQDEGAFFGVDI
jgi:hypothetical protein